MERKKSTQKTYSKDCVGAILEEIRSDFKVFGEDLSDVRQGVKNLEVEVSDLRKLKVSSLKRSCFFQIPKLLQPRFFSPPTISHQQASLALAHLQHHQKRSDF
jgi:hypothetical protein